VSVVHLHFESRLAAPPSAILRSVLTMAGVNSELMPLVRMTYPAEYRNSVLNAAAAGRVVFNSWILLFGVLPVDRHALRFERVLPNGFDERSTSWLQRYWVHRRRVESRGPGAAVVDDLEFRPRLGWFTPLLRLFIRWMFQHRHEQLRRRYGLAPAD